MKSLISLIASKELKSNFRDQRGLIQILIFSFVLSGFSLLFVSNSELSLLDEAQVIYMITGAITAISAVISIIIGAASFAGEKDTATLVLLLLAPIGKKELVAGKTLGIFFVWLILYLISIPYIWALGSTGQNLAEAVVYLGIFGTPLVLGFGFFAMSISLKTGNTLTSLISSLVVFMLAGSPLLLSPGLRKSTVGQLLDILNPFACTLNTYDSVIIDSEYFGRQVIRFAVVLFFAALTFFFANKMTKAMKFK